MVKNSFLTKLTQPPITCSKLTIKTLEKGANTFKVNKDTRTMSLTEQNSVVFIVNFEHIEQ